MFRAGAEADKILRAVFERPTRGGFQNSAVNARPKWSKVEAGNQSLTKDFFSIPSVQSKANPTLKWPNIIAPL
jgi:hypothetical protein